MRCPALSEVELAATVQGCDIIEQSLCLVECILYVHYEKLSVVVANAFVTPRKYDSELLKVPMHVLNPSSQLVTLLKGTKVAQLTTVDSSMIGGVSQQGSSVTLEDISSAMQKLLWELVEISAANLNNHQQQKLSTLLSSFADFFALCNNDLGRTNKLSHNIPTGINQPVRQGARRVPPVENNWLINCVVHMYYLV